MCGVVAVSEWSAVLLLILSFISENDIVIKLVGADVSVFMSVSVFVSVVWDGGYKGE